MPRGTKDRAHGIGVIIQADTHLGQATSQGRVIHFGRPLVQGLAEALEQSPFVRLVAVQLETHGPEAEITQPPMHHLKRRHLLSDEEDLPARVDGARNDISDRLRFSGSGWALDQKIAPATNFLDGGDLR